MINQKTFFYLSVTCFMASQPICTYSSHVFINQFSPFKIVTKISGYFFNDADNNTQKLAGSIEESYSPVQNRSIMKYSITYQSKTIQGYYYHDITDGILLQSGGETCKRIDSDRLLEDLLGLPSMKSILSDEASFIVGPVVKLMKLAEKLDESHHYKPTTTTDGFSGFERKIVYQNPTTRQSIDVNLIHLVKNLDDLESQPFPTIIVINEFKRISLDLRISHSIPIDMDDTRDSQISLDHFTIPPESKVLECLNSMNHQVDLFENHYSHDASKTKLSFNYKGYKNKLEGNEWVKYEFEGYLAYDALLDIILLDRKWKQQMKFERYVMNLAQNRRYYQTWSNDPNRFGSGMTVPLNIVELVDKQTNLLVSTLVPVEDYKELDIGLSRILVGSSDFYYLGQTKVDGFESNLYVAKNALLPIWVQPPLDFREEPQNIGAKYSINVYTNANSTNHFEVPGPLRYIEIQADDVHYSIEINNFEWGFEQGYDMFALKDYFRNDVLWVAGKPTISVPTAKVDLELEMSTKKQVTLMGVDNGLFSPQERARSLVSSLQTDLGWSVNLIHDIESRLIIRPNAMSKIMILASLTVCYSTGQNLIKLKRSKTAIEYNRPKRNGNERIQTTSFEACVAISTSLFSRRNVYFGFNPNSSECYLISDPITDEKDENFEKIGLKVDPKGRIEIFEAHLESDRVSETISTSFEEKNRIFSKFLKLRAISPDGPVEFRIKNIEIDSIVSGSDGQPTDQSDIISLDNFNGFGIVADGDKSKIIEASHLTAMHLSNLINQHRIEQTNYEQPMTRDQCHAVCLNDPQCQSYSLCIRQDGLECVNSEIDFRDPEVAVQLANAISNGNINVSMHGHSDGFVTLRKHPNCELHNKHYLELYNKLGQMTNDSVSDKSVYQIPSDSLLNGRELCAELCFRYNIEYLAKDIENKSQLVKDFPTEAWYSDWIPKFKSNNNYEVCSGFHFFEPVDSDTKGYCVLDGGKLVQSRVIINSEKLNNRPEVYSFKFESFFDKYYGVKLESVDNFHLQDVYKLVSGNSVSGTINQTGLDSLKSYIDEGGNFQSFVFDTDASICAELCIKQKRSPWPACRSFAMVKAYLYIKPICIMNSVTMLQALNNNGTQSPRVIGMGDKNQASWRYYTHHFEPKAGLMVERLSHDVQIEFQKDEVFVTRLDDQTKPIGLFFGFCTACLALGCGIVISAKLMPYLIEKFTLRRSRASVEDITSLWGREML